MGAIDVQAQGDQRAIILTCLAGGQVPFETYVIPLDAANAEAIGRKLTAPSVQVAGVSELRAVKDNPQA
jgi:hypothetical protein